MFGLALDNLDILSGQVSCVCKIVVIYWYRGNVAKYVAFVIVNVIQIPGACILFHFSF